MDATPARSPGKSRSGSSARRTRPERRLRELRVALRERSYTIRIGPGLLQNPDSFEFLRGRPLRVLTDSNVANHYLLSCLSGLQLGTEHALVLPAGETTKTWASAERVLDWLLAANLPRDAVLIALGGGVIGDLAGFCAAIYQRGIDFVQLPTTLLAQVDSSVGGKTGVNHARGKNLIGAFHQPIAVIADTDTLKTLPARELSAGLAEVIKSALLGDDALFRHLERDMDALLELDANCLGDAIERCCRLKARIVGVDERERVSGGPRALLNLGHTFGHAVETHTHYSAWLHGEAVGLGLCMAVDLSARMGWINHEDAARSMALVERARLPTRPPADMRPDDFLKLMARDKKVAAGKLRLILLRAIGEAQLTSDFDPARLDETLAHFCAPLPPAVTT
jgi:3-dehydroquinate synthase